MCGKCAEEGFIPLKKGTIYTLRYTMSSPLKSLYIFTLKEEILEEFAYITKEYLAKEQHYEFKSLDGIKDL